MNSLQQANFNDPNNQDSNDFSSTSFLHEFIHRQSVIKATSSGPTIPLNEKLKYLHHQLFITLTIFTSIRLKPLQFRKQLKNYQYQKIQRKIQSQSLTKFGKAQQQLFKQQQYLVLLLTSIMKQFRSSKQNYFYILTKKSSRVFFFHHQPNDKIQNIQSLLTICNLSQKMSNDLQSDKIPFELLRTGNCQTILIKNQAISIYWGRIVNKIVQNQKHFKSFYILTNFVFPGGSEILPTELFNGMENKKQYKYIAKSQTNIIGQKIQQVFKLKITGIWTLHNITNLTKTLTDLFGQNSFDIEFQIDRVTQYLNKQYDDNDNDKYQNYKT